ncbi:hypothetical protein Tco_0662711 [Tanacetum coccineum]
MVTGQQKLTIWNNAQRVNHQNKLTHPHPKRNFVPTAFLTKSSKVLVNTTKQSSSRAAVSNSTARYVNTAASRPTINGAKTCSNVFHKSHSSVKRTIYQRTAPKTVILKKKLILLSNPKYAFTDQGIFDSRCSRHMTGNKSYLTDYQDIDGGFVAILLEVQWRMLIPSEITKSRLHETFWCLVHLNTLDHLGKFEGKVDEGFLVGYSVNRSGPKWLFDIDSLIKSMNYEPVSAVNQTNDDAGPKKLNDSYTNRLNTVSPSVSAARQCFDNNDLPTNPLMPYLEDSTSIFRGAYNRRMRGKATSNNLETTMNISAIPTTRIHKRIILKTNCWSPTYIQLIQTRRMINSLMKIAKVKKLLYGATIKLLDLVLEPCLSYSLKIGLESTIDRLCSSKTKVNSLSYYDCKYNRRNEYSLAKHICADILKKFNFITMKTASNPIETNKALVKDEESDSVDVHLYRSMIRSLMYLTASRPDIMFVFCACASSKYSVKISHFSCEKDL